MDELDKIVEELMNGAHWRIYDREMQVRLGRRIKESLREHKHSMSALKRENRKLLAALRPALAVQNFKQRNFFSRWIVKVAHNIAKRIYELN